MKRRKSMMSMILFLFVLLCLWQKEAKAEEYFENPADTYAPFQTQVYNQEYEIKYGFAREKTDVYQDHKGSKVSGKIEKFTGVIIVSETESYVQVIYHKEDGYDIGWITREFYKDEVKLYNGAEKQLLGDGIYELTNEKEDRTYYVELTFEGNQLYSVKSIKTGGYLEVEYDKDDVVTGLFWNDPNNAGAQDWELIRSYDGFYIKNPDSCMYLVPRGQTGLGLTPILEDLDNIFDQEGISEAYQTAVWKLSRKFDNNVDPYRNFLQYDPDWGKEDYGKVNGDYGGKMAAAGCGVVSMTNMIYALTGQFIDPMVLADFAVENHYRIIGSGTEDGIFAAAAKEFGDAYEFRFVKRCYNVFQMRDYLKQGCVAISYVPGHYVTVADYNAEKETYLVLDSHPIPKRPTSPWGDWFPWQKLESGGLASSCYYIFEKN